MALNFSRCVAIFGSSWSEGRPSNTTFSPSALAGCLVALEKVGEPPPTPNCPNLRGHPRATATVAAREDAGQHSWSNARQIPSVQPGSNFKERRFTGSTIPSADFGHRVGRPLYDKPT